MTQFQIGVLTVSGMYAVFLLVGWLASRKVREGTAEEMILAGRGLPLWLAIMTMTATWVDGGYLNGTTEEVYKGSVARALQPGLCFGISLILGGLFFAREMRRREYTTLIDPFAERFGRRWAAVLFLPAMAGETFWCGALLVAIGSTFQVLLGIDLRTAVLVSAAVVSFYTMIGGMWSVAYTDAFQLLLIPTGLCIALAFALPKVGGLDYCLTSFETAHPGGTRLFPPATPNAQWSAVDLVGYWDLALMLMLGGIPWNCYFQRVLSCKTPERARWHSILSGFLTIALTVPPVLLGLVAATAFTGDAALENPTLALPQVLHQLVPFAVGLIGMAAIVGAVTSSFSSSILSAGSMFSWNVYRPLLAPSTSVDTMRRVIRGAILAVTGVAVLLALRVGSVYQLWTFTADLVFVLLFPQLVYALYDPKVNRIGSVVAFVVALVLRLGGGEPILGIPTFIDYPQLLPIGLAGDVEWYRTDAAGTVTLLYPFRTLAAVAGLILLPVVSRLTARWDPPTPLRPLNTTGEGTS
jgi:high affinity choline transporter 7